MTGAGESSRNRGFRTQHPLPRLAALPWRVSCRSGFSGPLPSRQTREPSGCWGPSAGDRPARGIWPSGSSSERSFPLYLALPNFLLELGARVRKRMQEARAPGRSSGSRTAQLPGLRSLGRDQNAPRDSAHLAPAPGLQGREPGVRRRLHLPRGGTTLARRAPGGEVARAPGAGRALPAQPRGPAPGGRIRKQ